MTAGSAGAEGTGAAAGGGAADTVEDATALRPDTIAAEDSAVDEDGDEEPTVLTTAGAAPRSRSRLDGDAARAWP